MPHLSSDQLRDISVAVVEDFINNKTPLSQGLAKQAAAHDLNVDQIQRCVEASNTIAQLKLMSVAEDRTFEFPLCKAAEVMQAAALPVIEKSASVLSSVTAESAMEKSASETAGFQLSEHEAKVLFIKEASANARSVEELEVRAEAVRSQLVKLASAISKDMHGLDKVACVVDAELVPAITTLVYGEQRTVRDFGAAKTGLFKAAELKGVVTLQDLYKEARAIVTELNHRKDLQKRASAVSEGLQKEALAGFAGMLGRGVGNVIGGVGKVALSPIKGLGKSTAGAATSAVKGTFKGVPTAKMAPGAAGLTIGASLGSNAMLLEHNPGTNTITGKSRDVWSSLQG